MPYLFYKLKTAWKKIGVLLLMRIHADLDPDLQHRYICMYKDNVKSEHPTGYYNVFTYTAVTRVHLLHYLCIYTYRISTVYWIQEYIFPFPCSSNCQNILFITFIQQLGDFMWAWHSACGRSATGHLRSADPLWMSRKLCRYRTTPLKRLYGQDFLSVST